VRSHPHIGTTKHAAILLLSNRALTDMRFARLDLGAKAAALPVDRSLREKVSGIMEELDVARPTACANQPCVAD